MFEIVMGIDDFLIQLVKYCNRVLIELFMPFSIFMLLIEGLSVIFWQNKHLLSIFYLLKHFCQFWQNLRSFFSAHPSFLITVSNNINYRNKIYSFVSYGSAFTTAIFLYW